MAKSMVRVWTLRVLHGGRPLDLFVSYPEDNAGFELLSCTACGHVYSADVARRVYVGPPLAEKIERAACIGCGARLGETLRPYPENFAVGGKVFEFRRPQLIPEVADSAIVAFDEIYG
jgi:hypothetical protein